MRIRVVVALCLLVVAGGAAGAAGQDVVKVGHLGITADAPVYIALEKGYFKERRIELKLEPFASAVPAMAPLSSGEIQVVGGGVSPTLFNAFARAFPVRVVGPRARDVEGNALDTLMVRGDLKGQVTRAADLKGKKVAINAPGSPHYYLLGRLLESEGLSLKDVEIVHMPWPDMAAAFANKAIDVAALVEPFATLYEEKGLATVWKRASDVIKNPGWEIAVLFFNEDWARKNPRVANDFMVAYLKGARDMMDAWNGGRNRAEVVDIMIKHTRVKDRALYDRMHWGFIDPNGGILKDSLRDQQEFFARLGSVPKKVDVDGILDDRYVKYAVEQLGRK
jgi:NitT/TauT family transport system substrate-binding protein